MPKGGKASRSLFGVFLLSPQGLVGRIAAIIDYWLSNKEYWVFNRYLWGGSAAEKARGKISWSKLCLPKKEGALYIREWLIGSWNNASILRHI